MTSHEISWPGSVQHVEHQLGAQGVLSLRAPWLRARPELPFWHLQPQPLHVEGLCPARHLAEVWKDYRCVWGAGACGVSLPLQSSFKQP